MVEPKDPAVTAEQERILQMLEAARRALAPQSTISEYYQAVREFETRQLGRVEHLSFKNRVVSTDEAAKLPDNSAKFETLSYRYRGLAGVRDLLADGQPVAFVGWHHGARQHADYALARMFPDIAIFTRWVVQYGTVFSIPMATLGGLGLVKMKRFLEDGRPVFYYLDGAPLGECVKLTIMGMSCNFSTTPMKLFRSVAGLRIVPVANNYIDQTGVEVNFLPALGMDGALADMSERDILAALVARLEQEQRKRAPFQVLVNYLTHREVLAGRARREIAARKAERRKKT